MTDSTPLVREQHGAVLVARLDRPDARNALSPELIGTIGAAILDAERSDGIRVLVITGTGDRAFCAGMDLRAFSEGTGFSLDGESGQAFFRLLERDVSVPVIGAANGAAVAGGFELLLGCDMIVAADHAKFGLPEVQRGLLPAGGGTFLGARVAQNVATELMLTGDSISAARAYEIGLVNHVVPAEDVLPRALALAERIASNGPLAVRAIKELARFGSTDTARGWERMRELQPIVFASEDAREGAVAFLEKRAPVWQGR